MPKKLFLRCEYIQKSLIMEDNKEKLNAIAENKTYDDYDSIIIQLNNGETSIGNIKMMRQDLEVMMKLHGESRANILELLVQTIESESPKFKEHAK